MIYLPERIYKFFPLVVGFIGFVSITTLPSVITFILGGILIGYMLWIYRMRAQYLS